MLPHSLGPAHLNPHVRGAAVQLHFSSRHVSYLGSAAPHSGFISQFASSARGALSCNRNASNRVSAGQQLHSHDRGSRGATQSPSHDLCACVTELVGLLGGPVSHFMVESFLGVLGHAGVIESRSRGKNTFSSSEKTPSKE